MQKFESELIRFVEKLGCELNCHGGRLQLMEVKKMHANAVTQADRTKILQDFFKFKLVLNVRMRVMLWTLNVCFMLAGWEKQGKHAIQIEKHQCGTLEKRAQGPIDH
jgi:hypothetical protein